MDLSTIYNDKIIIDAIKHNNGPLLINAGPGAGKTQLLTTKAAYLLLQEQMKEEEIILCTFTEKAALELKTRIKNLLFKIDPVKAQKINIEKINTGTIHAIFLNFLKENVNYTNLSPGFSLLSELDRKLFIYHNLDKFNFDTYYIPTSSGKKKLFYHFDSVNIFSQEVDGWMLTDYLCKFFDCIVDQGVEIYGVENFLGKIKDPSYRQLFNSYFIYKKLLHSKNLIDFSQLQNEYWHLLQIKEVRLKIRDRIKYVLVDEYQDTNYIQERALLETIGNTANGDTEITNYESGNKYKSKNITVVGDFNQSLYRFRGANIDNILTFDKKFLCAVKTLKLLKNYRSTASIIDLSNKYIQSNLNYYKKRIKINPEDFKILPGQNKDDYPIITIKSEGAKTIDFVMKIKSLVDHLLSTNKIQKLSDIAILLPSLKYTEAKCFIEAFGRNIKVTEEFDFFNNDLIITFLRSFAQIFNIKYIDESRTASEFKLYFEDNIFNKCPFSKAEITELKKYYDKNNDLVNYMYFMLSNAKFAIFNNEKYYHYLGKLSYLLDRFTSFSTSKDMISFFEEYLPFIFNHTEEFFDTKTELTENKINLLTIHQSKGLQFPVVIVGYNKSVSTNRTLPLFSDPRKFITEIIGRKEIENDSIVEEMQLRRLFYVAFTRAKELLIIGSRTNKISQLTKLKDVNFNLKTDYKAIIPDTFHYNSELTEITKPIFSYTGDILTYNLCPQLYAFLNEFELKAIDNSDFSFGKFIHQTIENLNKKIIEGNHFLNLKGLQDLAHEIFEFNFSKSRESDKFKDQKNLALFQILNYVNNFHYLLNPNNIESVEETFVWEEKEFILRGKMDVVFKSENELLIVDVKSGRKEKRTPTDIENFENQIKLYGNYYYDKYGINPRLLIFSTGESQHKEGEHHVEFTNFSQVTEKLRNVILKIIDKDYSLDYQKLNLAVVCPDCPFNQFCKYKIIQ